MSARQNLLKKKWLFSFFKIGIDAEGYAANFCENEQIVEFGTTTLSWIAIRGSIPLFWE